jgi:tetratricopeptide (TPR) repeat protein
MYLEAFHVKGENKGLRLIELIEKKPDISQEEASQILYGKPKTKAMIMLRSRLLDRMLDLLSLSINLQGNPSYKEDPPLLELVQIYKLYSQALLLRRRGLDDLASELLQRIEKQAELLGLPEAQLMAALQLRNLSSSRQEVGLRFKGEIEKALQEYGQDITGAGYFDEFRVIHADRTSSTPEKIEFLEKASQELEALLAEGYSLRAHYYYLNLLFSLHQLRHKHEASRNVLQELVDLVGSHPGLNSPYRQAVPYLRLARLELILHNFDAAYDAARHARSIINPQRNNFLSATTYLLFACIYTRRLEEVLKTVRELPELTGRKKPLRIESILHYLESCAWFMLEDYEQALDALFAADKLLADKGGWNLGMRIYEILILIEMEKYDLVSSRIETLRKHLSRYEGKPRELYIHRYLYLLDRNAYDFSAENEEMKEILLKLADEVTWEPVSHEVIRFDCWVNSKRQRKNFGETLMEVL